MGGSDFSDAILQLLGERKKANRTPPHQSSFTDRQTNEAQPKAMRHESRLGPKIVLGPARLGVGALLLEPPNTVVYTDWF
ncbi:MAG: hypothetical protein EBS01_00725 [Verrucomicrobia bacterium]|nr:hypothetical protein [Verrucomicrobiota bacterium]